MQFTPENSALVKRATVGRLTGPRHDELFPVEDQINLMAVTALTGPEMTLAQYLELRAEVQAAHAVIIVRRHEFANGSDRSLDAALTREVRAAVFAPSAA